MNAAGAAFSVVCDRNDVFQQANFHGREFTKFLRILHVTISSQSESPSETRRKDRRQRFRVSTWINRMNRIELRENCPARDSSAREFGEIPRPLKKYYPLFH